MFSTALAYDPAILLLHIDPREIKTGLHKNSYIVVATLFIIAKKRNSPDVAKYSVVIKWNIIQQLKGIKYCYIPQHG